MISGEVLTQPIVGYRSWTIDPKGRLFSPIYARDESYWNIGERKTAKCQCSGCKCPACIDNCQHPTNKLAPYFSCTCGIYAYRELKNLVFSVKSLSTMRIFGTVSLWGKVIEHQHGFRAEFAYPAAFYLPVTPVLFDAKDIANRYGAECQDMPSALADKHRWIGAPKFIELGKE